MVTAYCTLWITPESILLFTTTYFSKKLKDSHIDWSSRAMDVVAIACGNLRRTSVFKPYPEHYPLANNSWLQP